MVRITHRRRHAYSTASNKIVKFRTPGGRLGVQYRTKIAKGPRCGDTGVPLQGIPALRSRAYSRLSKRQKTVSRAYGGSRSAAAVRDRIVRAFLVEEQKIVKHVLKRQAALKSKESKSEKTTKPASKSKAKAKK